MIPELRLEVPDTPDRIRRPVSLHPGRSNQNDRPRNLRLSLSRRTEQPIIDLSSPIPPNDDQRKRKSPSSVMSIPESSSPESHGSKRGKNVVQEVEDESCRGPTVRDNKGKGKVDTPSDDGCFQDLSTEPGLNSPPRRVGQRLLVRSGVTAPSNTARRDVAINHVSTEGVLNEVGEADRRGPAVRDDKGKGKLNGHASNDEIQVISPSQTGSTVLPRPVRRRFLVRNGVIAPINIAERNTASNNGNTRDDASAAKRAELGADRKVTVSQSSGVMQRTSGGQGSRPAGSSSVGVGGVGDVVVLSEIVADDPCRDRVIRSRRSILYGYTSDRGTSTYFQLEYEDEIDARENSATGPSSTSTWRSTQSDMPGRFNQPSSGSSRPNLAVSTASVSATTRPISGASTLTSRTGGLGAHPQRGRIRTASSLYEVGSSSATRNLRTQATDLTAATQAARIRRFQGQGAVLQPVIDVDEIDSPDAAASVRGQQLARDEMIARQLQEELYNEIPGDWNMDEMDARMAMSLQQEENAMRSSPIRRRASRVGRSVQFVAASSLARNNFRLQILQDFDSDDYETLLALDENNHQHTGASTSQINTLPESVVTSSNLDETCAVCLETPSIGEKIRHLPCFHKFHKDCIDQWLQRKKECPICKCSIF